MLFKEKVYRNKKHGGRRGITIAHLEPLAQVELNIINAFVKAYTCKILTQFFLLPPFVIDWLSNNYTITTTNDRQFYNL